MKTDSGTVPSHSLDWAPSNVDAFAHGSRTSKCRHAEFPSLLFIAKWEFILASHASYQNKQAQSRPCCTLKYTSNLVLTSELEALRTVLAQLMEGLARTSLTNITVHEAAPRYTKGRIFPFALKAPHLAGWQVPECFGSSKKTFKMLNNPKPQGYFDFLLRHRKYKTHRWLSPEWVQYNNHGKKIWLHSQ